VADKDGWITIPRRGGGALPERGRKAVRTDRTAGAPIDVTDEAALAAAAREVHLRLEPHLASTLVHDLASGMAKLVRAFLHQTEPPPTSAPSDSKLEEGCDGPVPLAIVCYGLGNFASTTKTQRQLAVLVALKALLRSARCEVYDPVFTPVRGCGYVGRDVCSGYCVC